MHQLTEIQQFIHKAFAETQFRNEPRHLYEPIDYTLAQGGKRLRPVLVLLACELFGGDIEKALYPAMGLEIFHNFTLLHDDIMDHAPLRRGKETVHQKWDINTAILSGDTMFVLAYEFVAKTVPELLPDVLVLFNDTARKVCEGQQYDMNYESQEMVTIDDYMLMIRLKTAVLIACSLKLGAIIAGADETAAAKIYEAGIELGLAFQLQDDFLDAFGDEIKFGKAIGNDIATNKKTYLYLKARELATNSQLERMNELSHIQETGLPGKINDFIAIYRDLNIESLTRHKIEQHHQQALALIDSFRFSEESSRPLKLLMNEMLSREK
jgi:geranylgeranyl diphosphate synthase type II